MGHVRVPSDRMASQLSCAYKISNLAVALCRQQVERAGCELHHMQPVGRCACTSTRPPGWRPHPEVSLWQA